MDITPPNLDYSNMPLSHDARVRLLWDMAHIALIGGSVYTTNPALGIALTLFLTEDNTTKAQLEWRRNAAANEAKDMKDDLASLHAFTAVHELMNALLDPMNDAAFGTLRTRCEEFIRYHRGGQDNVDEYLRRIGHYELSLRFASQMRRQCSLP